jgi:pantetheine-phosphate adenylyltransferase
VNIEKQPTSTQIERVTQVKRQLSADWHNVEVTAWAGLTVSFCEQHGADLIIRGVRNSSDALHEYQLAAMNQHMGITTLLLAAQPGLTNMSSTLVRGLANTPES